MKETGNTNREYKSTVAGLTLTLAMLSFMLAKVGRRCFTDPFSI